MRRLWPLMWLSGCQCAPVESVTDLVVEVEYPGASAREVSELALLPLEVELSNLDGVAHMAAIAEDGHGRLYLRLWGAGDGLAALQSSRERLARVHEVLPQDVGGLRVWEARPASAWVADVPAEQASGVVAELALAGVPSEASTASRGRLVWTVDPAALGRLSVLPTDLVAAVDGAIDAGEPVGEELQIPIYRGGGSSVRLGALASVSREAGDSQVWLDGNAVSMVLVQGDNTLDGWTRFGAAASGPWCGVFDGLGAERPDPVGLWARQGGRWVVRGLDAPDRLRRHAFASMWPCADASTARVAVVGDGADLDVALAGLAAVPGVLAVVPVAVNARMPQLRLDVEASMSTTLGISMSDIVKNMAWSGMTRPGDNRLVLRLPERDVAGLSALPVLSPSAGALVPLGTVASVVIVPPEPPIVRIDGRDARFVDVVVDEPSAVDRWPVPSDVDLLKLPGLGPQWVGL